MNQGKFLRLITNLTILVATLFLNACGAPPTISPTSTPIPPTATPTPSETLLGNYEENGVGGFSHRWLAYIIEPQEEATDQSWFVDLNGQRLGPYSSMSRRIEISLNGEHIAFAAERDGKWYIVVDGQEKWEHEGLGWAWYAWTPDLEGKSFIPQTQAAILEFSPNGDQLAYMVSVNGTEWAIFLDGKPGQTFQSVGSGIQFVGEKVTYSAEDSAGEVYIYGDSILGPYQETWRAKHSSDGNHFVFAAKKQGKHTLIVDGQEQDLSGEIDSYEMGPAGELAYSTKSDAGVKVYLGDRELPGEYDEIAQLTVSPDGKHAAFWARQGSKWSVVTDIKNYPGFDGYYFYESGSEIYSILWDNESANLAYFAKEGEDIILALNGEQQPMPDFPGIATTAYVDDQGNIVGVSLMGGLFLHRQAFVQCLLQRASLKCDPLSATLMRGELAYIETSETESFMVMGSQREGPYASIESILLSSADNKHYAYIVSTEKGQQMVLDGKLMDWVYDVIYRPQFIDDGGFGHLGKRDDKIFSVFYPYP